MLESCGAKVLCVSLSVSLFCLLVFTLSAILFLYSSSGSISSPNEYLRKYLIRSCLKISFVTFCFSFLNSFPALFLLLIVPLLILAIKSLTNFNSLLFFLSYDMHPLLQLSLHIHLYQSSKINQYYYLV